MATVQRHKTWLADMASRGWKCGEVYSEGDKTHPCMKSWFDLTPEQQSTFRNTGAHEMTEGVAPKKKVGRRKSSAND